MGAYLVWERRLSALRCFVSAGGLLLSLGPGLAWWAGAAALAPAGYADASLWENLVGRFLLGTAHATPVWHYLESLPRAKLRDPDTVAEAVRRAVRGAVAGRWGKKPMCHVHVLTV